MEYYTKGKNVEEPLDKEKIPIKNLPQDFIWMQVRGGSKIRNLLTYALNEFSNKKPVIWTGFGPSVGKAVTCAEIMKREYKNRLHQITKISYYVIDEYWDPKIAELDPIVVKKKLPMIHILLSLTPLTSEDLSYQAPGLTIGHSKGGFHSNSLSEKEGDSFHKRHRNRQKNTPKQQTDQTSQGQ